MLPVTTNDAGKITDGGRDTEQRPMPTVRTSLDKSIGKKMRVQDASDGEGHNDVVPLHQQIGNREELGIFRG